MNNDDQNLPLNELGSQQSDPQQDNSDSGALGATPSDALNGAATPSNDLDGGLSGSQSSVNSSQDTSGLDSNVQTPTLGTTTTEISSEESSTPSEYASPTPTPASVPPAEIDYTSILKAAAEEENEKKKFNLSFSQIDFYIIKSFFANFLIPLVSLVLTLGLYFFVISKNYQQLPEVQAELQQAKLLETSLVAKKQKLETLADFKSSVEENNELLEKVLSEESAAPQLLTQITQIIQETGVELKSISHSLGQPSGEFSYDVVVASVAVTGTYDQTIELLRNIDNAGRVLITTNFRFGLDDTQNIANSTFSIASPFISVDTSATTDEPISFDLNSPEFIDVLDRVKTMKIYEITLDDVLLFEETQQEALEAGQEQEQLEGEETVEEEVEVEEVEEVEESASEIDDLPPPSLEELEENNDASDLEITP